MSLSYKSVPLLDEPTEYHLELREFFASRLIQTGHPADLPDFLERLKDPELAEEVGCLLRSVIFREEGEVASSYLLTLLELAVGGPDASSGGRISSATTQRLLALIAQATHGLGSSLAHTPYQGHCEEKQSDEAEPELPSSIAVDAKDLYLGTSPTQTIEPGKRAVKTAGLLSILQRSYWIPAGAVSVLAAVLCVYLPRSHDQTAHSAPIRSHQVYATAVPSQRLHTGRSPHLLSRPKSAQLPQHALSVPAPHTQLHTHDLLSPRVQEPHPPSPASLYPSTSTEVAPKVLFATSGLVASHLLYAPAPAYPPAAEAQHLQGTVLLRLLINQAGKVASTQILRGSAPFAEAAVHAVQSWRYQPFVTDGTAYVTTMVTISFRLPFELHRSF